MHFTKKTVSEKRSDLVKALQSKKLLRFPGAYNPLCAKLIAEIGFDGVYVSGGVMSNDLGLPDICLLYTSPSPRDRQKSRMPSSA